MKPIRLLLFLLPAMPVFSQNYFPFIQYGTYRDEFWAPELQICTYSHGARYWFRGDTVVNGQTYYQLWSADILGAAGAPPFCPPYTVDTSDCVLISLLREDISEKKVYQLQAGVNTEFLLFDFSAMQGDSVTVGNPPQTVFVHDVWFETWADGSSRKLMVIDLPIGGQTFWMESLGASNDLWNPVSELCICPHGFCYEQNGQGVYGSPCAMAVHSEEPEMEFQGIWVAPNPTASVLNIRMPDGLDIRCTHVAVVNFLGVTVMQKPFPADMSSAELQVGQLPAGMYQLVFWNGMNRVGAQRFQKV